MTFPRLTPMHHHRPGNIPGLEELIQELIDEALEGFEGGGGTAVIPERVLFDASGMTDGADTFATPDFFEEDSTRVFLNGSLQRPIVDYSEHVTLDGILFVAAPAIDDELLIDYVAQEA